MSRLPQSYKGWTASKLIEFEADIASLFETGKIRSPVHLSGGNEQQLIDVFAEKDIGREDIWCFGTHRSHYHALLKGIPREWLKAEILANHSISINNAEHHFFSSAIVGGILPIAVGVAMTGQTVWCFVGDMASCTGIFQETTIYAATHQLPITFIIEDNRLSVQTSTKAVWGAECWSLSQGRSSVWYYRYKLKWPHQGTSKWVQF